MLFIKASGWKGQLYLIIKCGQNWAQHIETKDQDKKHEEDDDDKAKKGHKTTTNNQDPQDTPAGRRIKPSILF